MSFSHSLGITTTATLTVGTADEPTPSIRKYSYMYL